jgi:TM2 domain-containing membrane protein YozV
MFEESTKSEGAPPPLTESKYCSGCGAVIHKTAVQCPRCGAPQGSVGGVSDLTATTPSGRSRLAAALFALFLGGLGIHKFYLGRVGWGVVYLLFCWTGIPIIAGWVEAILYLVMTNEKFAAKYG